VIEYYYYIKNDPNKEILGKVFTTTRLAAAKEFAAQKRLPLKTFLLIWAVSKKKAF
jgi:hypothetical protein